MKMIKISTLGAAAVILLTSAMYVGGEATPQRQSEKPKLNKGFAVLELFTSEGCSSCPPADELFGRIQQQAGDKPIYLLSYHVDYWNRLGWKDAFSSPDFSKRQYQYNNLFTSQVYTPQLIINGQSEFVGSNENDTRKTISAALDGKQTTTLNLSTQQKANNLFVNYQIKGELVEGKLLIALVQKHATSQVQAGENSGRTLSHAQIVRSLNTFTLDNTGKGTVNIKLLPGYSNDGWEVIGMIQNPKTGEIMAVNQIVTK